MSPPESGVSLLEVAVFGVLLAPVKAFNQSADDKQARRRMLFDLWGDDIRAPDGTSLREALRQNGWIFEIR